MDIYVNTLYIEITWGVCESLVINVLSVMIIFIL